MPITIDSLLTLDQASVDTQVDTLTQLLQEYVPDTDLRRGAVRDLVLSLKGILAAASQANLDLVRRSCSLLAITEDPTLADDDVVNRVMSNYRLTRTAGAYASGKIVIVLSSASATVIPAGAVFTISSQTFTTATAFSARTDSTLVVTDTDRLITQIGTNMYAFEIDVTADAIGSAGNVKRAATATPSSTIALFVKAYAKADFTGGVDEETNAQLLDRQAAGLAVQTWGSRVSLESMIRNSGVVPSLVDLSVIGYGDAEMWRDQHGLWPVSSGSRTDVYLRSQALWQTVTVTKTATLISKVSATGTWQLTLLRDDAPGCYEITKIQLPSTDASSAGFTPATETRSMSLVEDTTHEFIPDIGTAVEAAYTPYQTITLTFADTVTNATSLAIGSTASYNVVARLMPKILELQQYLCDRDRRPPTGDVLVKAAIPCFVTVGCKITMTPGVTSPSVAAVKAAIATAINQLGIVSQLSSATVIGAIQTVATSGVAAISDIIMTGRIRCPDGTTVNLSDASLLTIPENGATTMVSGRTTAFLCDQADVSVTVVTS